MPQLITLALRFSEGSDGVISSTAAPIAIISPAGMRLPWTRGVRQRSEKCRLAAAWRIQDFKGRIAG
jgi:hypothetical protein